jgi:hypothetical protein
MWNEAIEKNLEVSGRDLTENVKYFVSDAVSVRFG